MKRIILSVLLILGGAAVFVLGNPYYTVFPTNRNQNYLIALVLFFLDVKKHLGFWLVSRLGQSMRHSQENGRSELSG